MSLFDDTFQSIPFLFYRNVICAYWTKKDVWDFFNLQIALSSKVFNVDAMFQERRKKSKNPAHTFGVHYISDIISKFYENLSTIGRK